MMKIPEDTQFLKWLEVIWLSLVTILTFLLYAQVLQGDFLFDDLRLILNNPGIRLTELSLDGLLGVMTGTRPIAMLSIAFNYYLHGYDVAGYHLFNITIHVLTGVVFYYFVKLTLQLSAEVKSKKQAVFLSLAITTLWLIHPVQTQSVSYVIQRMNGLAGLFFILSMLCYVVGRCQTRWVRGVLYCLSAMSCILAVGSKEMAITLPFFIALYEWYFFQDLSFNWMRKALLVLLTGCGCVAGILFIFPEFLPVGIFSSGYSLYSFTMEQRLFTELRVVVYYVSLLFLPAPQRLNLDYDFPLSYSMTNPWATSGAGLVLVLMLFSAIGLARQQRLYSFAIIWFLGNLAIESTFIPLDLVMEHRLYVPSMMIIVLSVVFFAKMVRQPYVRLSCFLMCLILLSTWTFERNKVWQSPLTLMVDTAMKSPFKARPAYNVACEYAKQGDVVQAVFWLRKSVGLEGFNRWDLLKQDKDLQKIRDSEEFRQFYLEHVSAVE